MLNAGYKTAASTSFSATHKEQARPTNNSPTTPENKMKFSVVFAVLVLAIVIGNADGLSCVGKWCSYEYKYQKKSCRWVFNWVPQYKCTWRDTNYKWCVHKWGSTPYSSYGEIEFWDDDRIVRNGNGKATSGTGAQCKHRSDIGSCKKETIQIDASVAWRC